MKKIVSVFVALIVLISVFVGSVYAEEQQRKLKIGDLITKLPTATFNELVTVTDDKNIENGEFSISWKEYEGAAAYSVKALFNINYMDKKAALNFLYEAEFMSETNSVTISGLQKERRYTVVVYALDSEGNEIAVYDSLPIFTYPKPEIENLEEETEDGISNNMILIIAASVMGALILIAVMVLILVLKKTKR